MTELHAGWSEVFDLVGAALELKPGERLAFLARSGADPWMQAEAASLLAVEEDGSCEMVESKLQVLLLKAAEDGLSAPELDEYAGLDLTGRIIGRYRILRELTSGGMGTVYLAERADGEFEQIVALKVISSVLPTKGLLKRFHVERQTLARLHHPHIAQLLDGGTTSEGRPYLVMEYIEGTDVCSYADEHRLNMRQRLELFLLICAAVQAAHQSLIVHCDLKPSNVLVTRDGFPKLLDFGIARVLAESRQELSIPDQEDLFVQHAAAWISSAQFALTPAYASPEQLAGETITTGSDVYSLGLLLCVLLSGVSPFERQRDGGESASPSRTGVAPSGLLAQERDKTKLEQVAKLRKVTPTKLIHGLQGDLDAIVLKAIRRDPKDRYLSVEQMAADLRAFLEMRPVAARAKTGRYRFSRFFARNRLAVLSAAALILALMAGTAAVAWQARKAERERERAVRRFNDVRGVAYTILFELSEAVKNLPGSTQAETLLAQRASEFLARMAQDAGSDAAFMRELATSYRKLGNLQGYPYSHNIGDTRGAAQSFRAAIHWDELANQKEPEDLNGQKDLATALDGLGSTVGGGAESLAAFDRAIRIDGVLVRSHPERDDFVRALALNYQHVSGPLHGQGRTADALDSLQKSLALCDRLVQKNPSDKASMQTLSFTAKRLGALLIQQEQWDAALAAYMRSLALDQASGHASPSDARKAYDSTFAYDDIGYIYWHRGQPRAGLPWYQKSLAIRKAAARQDPSNRRSEHGVATVQAYMAQIYTAMHEWERALALEREVYDTREHFLKETNSPLEAQLDLFDAEFRLAQTYRLWSQKTHGKEPRALAGATEWQIRAEQLGRSLLGGNQLAPAQASDLRTHLHEISTGDVLNAALTRK